MKFSTAVASGLGALTAVSAAPLKRNNGGSGKSDIDVTILQYALTLEHLENTFYSQALDKFDESAFKDGGFNRTLVSRIGQDESAHVNFLETALKGMNVTPTQPCTYDFGYGDDINAFFATANILEGVGVSAYLGAAAKIASDAYLTAAGSILTVEARHSAFIKDQLDYVPFPEAFDVPLDFDQVYSLASLFIKSCPSSNPSLPVKAFPALTAKAADKGQVMLTPADDSVFAGHKGDLYAIWVGYPENAVGTYSPKTGLVDVPKNFKGQQYVVISTSKDLSDDNTIAGPAVYNIAG